MDKILKKDKIILVSIVLLALLSLGAVSAFDNSNNNESIYYDEILSADCALPTAP